MLRPAAVSSFVLILFCSLFALAPAALASSYSSSFPVAENPISENGKWINGQTVGLDWTNVVTTSGLAFGTQSGSADSSDSLALLTGTWGSDQTVQATVRSVNQSDDLIEEVQLRLRNTLVANKATGYVIGFRCSKTGNSYARIVRWDGSLGSVTVLKSAKGSQYGVANGDVVKATIVGSTITVYINGTQVLQTSDLSLKAGSPGVGFSLQGATGVNSDFGFTNITVSDQTTTQKPLSTAAATAGNNSYSTNFPSTENPISEGGRWINGQDTGIDWKNVRTSTNFAYGTQTSTGGYDDSTAVLTGTWGLNQTATGTIRVPSPSTGEMELRLRTTIAAHSITGYEILCSVGYSQIVRWNGRLGDWTMMAASSRVCVNGDVLKATIVSNSNGSATITGYINGTKFAEATDNSPFTSGSPGIGMFNQGGSPVTSNGFSNFTATDSGSTSQTLSPPTGVSAVVH